MVFLTRADAQQHDARDDAEAAGPDEPLGPVPVEERADVDAADEAERGVEGEDPADGALVVVRELVRRHVRLQGRDAVHQPQRREEAGPRPEDDEPGPEAALGVRLVVPQERHAPGAGIGVIGIFLLGGSEYVRFLVPADGIDLALLKVSWIPRLCDRGRDMVRGVFTFFRFLHCSKS